MRSLAPLPAALFVSLVFSGCTSGGSVAEPLEEALAVEGTAIDPGTGDTLFLRPNWTVGRYWDAHVAVNFGSGFGFLEDIDGRLVVSEETAEGFTLGSDADNVGVFDSYFDSFYVGDFDQDLNPSMAGQKVRLYEWPLRAGASWTTPFPAQGFDTFLGRVDNVTLTVSRFEEDDGPFGPRLRVQGRTTWGELIDYDYAPKLGWMTYFRLTNETTGRIVLGLDLRSAGTDYHGEIHHLAIKSLYERVAVLPPCDEQGQCNPAFAPVPPVERFAVPDGLAFVEEIEFLFTFPIVAGAGIAAIAIHRANGEIDETRHVGAGDQFMVKFERNQVRSRTAGDWEVAIGLAGTAGLFVGVFGFADTLVTL